IYENAGFVADAARAYRTALDSGLAGADIAGARQGLAWVALLSQRARSAISGRILGVGDLDGDRRPELLVLTDDAIMALGWAGGHWAERARYRVAPDDRAKLWQDADPSGPDRWIGQLAALGGSPGPQLVLRARVWGFEGGRVHLMAELPYGAHAIGDLDGDGRDDLVVASAPGAGQRQLLMCRLAGDGALACHALASLARNESSIPALAVVDLDGDGRNELVMSEAAWTRYAVTIGQLSPAGFSIVAQRQLGSIHGLAAIDLDGDHRREIIAIKSHIYPSPRLFDIDPYLGPSGPMILSWDGQASLDRTWLDPVVPADSSDRHLGLEVVRSE